MRQIVCRLNSIVKHRYSVQSRVPLPPGQSLYHRAGRCQIAGPVAFDSTWKRRFSWCSGLHRCSKCHENYLRSILSTCYQMLPGSESGIARVIPSQATPFPARRAPPDATTLVPDILTAIRSHPVSLVTSMYSVSCHRYQQIGGIDGRTFSRRRNSVI